MRKSSVRKAIGKARIAFFSVGIFSGIINVLVLTGSIYMLQVYDRVLPSRSVPTLIGITVLLVVLYAGYGALDFARTRILSRIGLGIDRQLRAQVMEAVMLVPLRSRPGTDALQPVRDLDQIRTFLSGLGPTALFDMPWLPIYVALIYLVHPVLGVFALGAAVLLVALTILTEVKTKRPSLQALGSSASAPCIRRCSSPQRGGDPRHGARPSHAGSVGTDQRALSRRSDCHERCRHRHRHDVESAAPSAAVRHPRAGSLLGYQGRAVTGRADRRIDRTLPRAGAH